MHSLLSLSGWQRLQMLVFIAWRNIWRNPVRSLLTVSALSGGLIMVILYATLVEGMSRQMSRFATEISTGHIQLQRQAWLDNQDLYAYLPESWVPLMEEALPGVSIAPRLYAAGLASSEQTSTGVMIKAIVPEQEAQVTRLLQHLRSGKADFSVHDGEYGPVYGVLVGAQLARSMNLSPGSELILVTQAVDGSIGNALFQVTGVLSPVEPTFDRSGVLMSIAAYRSLMALPEGVHELVIHLASSHLEDSHQLIQIQQAVSAALPDWQKANPLSEWGGQVVVRNWREITPAVADMVALSQSMVWVIGAIIIGLASLGMLNTMLMAIHERTHEFGILLAIGMKRRWLLLMVLMESFFLALVSALTGGLLGSVLGGYFTLHGIDFSASMPDGYDWGGVVFEPVMEGYLLWQDVFNACLLMIGITLLASLIPSWRTVRLQPAEAMR